MLKQEMRKSGRAFKQVVNDTLRLGLTAAKQPAGKRFVVKAKNLGLPHYDKTDEYIEFLEGPDHR